MSLHRHGSRFVVAFTSVLLLPGAALAQRARGPAPSTPAPAPAPAGSKDAKAAYKRFTELTGAVPLGMDLDTALRTKMQGVGPWVEPSGGSEAAKAQDWARKVGSFLDLAERHFLMFVKGTLVKLDPQSAEHAEVSKWITGFEADLARWQGELDGKVQAAAATAGAAKQVVADYQMLVRKYEFPHLDYLFQRQRNPAYMPGATPADAFRDALAEWKALDGLAWLGDLAAHCKDKVAGAKMPDNGKGYCKIAMEAKAIMQAHLVAGARDLVSKRAKEIDQADRVAANDYLVMTGLEDMVRGKELEQEMTKLLQPVFATAGQPLPDEVIAPLREALAKMRKAVDEHTPTSQLPQAVAKLGEVARAVKPMVAEARFAGDKVKLVMTRTSIDPQIGRKGWDVVQRNLLNQPVKRATDAIVVLKVKGISACVMAKLVVWQEGSGTKWEAPTVELSNLNHLWLVNCKAK